MALKSIGRSEKSSQTLEQKETTHDEDSDDDEMTFIIKRFQHLANKNRRFFGKIIWFQQNKP